jgi:uncharacterized C2H2 Zn-finger protein
MSEPTTYNCPSCPKTFKYFKSYKNHVLTVHASARQQEYASLNPGKQVDPSDIVCPACSLTFYSKYTLSRHTKLYCKARSTSSPTNVLLGVNPEIIRAVADIFKASLGLTNYPSVSNDNNSGNQTRQNIENNGQIDTLNNNNIATQNNTQNNLQVSQDIHINPLGKENLSHISKGEILEMLHLGAGAVPALARAILELPENRNIAGYDKKNGKVMFVNRKGKVEIGNLDKVIGWFTDDNIGRVNNYITEYDDEFQSNDRLIHRLKVMQGHETIEGDDEEEHNRIYDSYFENCSSQLKDAIEVNSKQALHRLKKFRDFMEQNKVLGYFPPVS